MSDPYDNFPLARANDFPGKRERHPRTVMLDLLEALRLTIQANREHLSAAQILAVLASVADDHAGVAFDALAKPQQ